MSRKYLIDTGHIANNLTTTASGKVLDARQGKTLKGQVDAKLAAANVYNGLDKTASGYALDARQGKALCDTIPAYNLLDNADWRYSLVCQRGIRNLHIVSTSSNTPYIDRWLIKGEAVITVYDNWTVAFIDLDTGAILIQRIEAEFNVLAGKKVTFAYEDHLGNVAAASRTFPTSNTESGGVTCGNLTVKVGFSNGVGYLKLTAAANASIARVWLEFGEACHMSATPPRGYAENLAICQRYFMRYGNAGNIRYIGYAVCEDAAYSSGGETYCLSRCVIPLPASMYDKYGSDPDIEPAAAVTGTEAGTDTPGTLKLRLGSTDTAHTIQRTTVTGNALVLRLLGPSGTYAVGAVTLVKLEAGVFLEISAEM